MGEVEIVVKVPEGINEKVIRKIIAKALKKAEPKAWESLFGVAKSLPEFKEEDRADVRL